MDMLLFSVLVLVVFFPLLALIAVTLRYVLWLLNPLFFGINYLIWFFYNPLRGSMKNKNTSSSSILFTIAFYSLVVPSYWLLIHITLTPLRVINALYFDVLLYLSVMIQDLLAELFDPKGGGMQHLRGSRYLLAYVLGFPKRFLQFFLRNLLTLIDSVFMFAMGVLLPTFTLYHGTDFKRAISKIGQQGQWLIGSGEFAGRGIYFGIEKRTAEHYARNYSTRGIVVARVTLSFVRNASSLSKRVRELVGHDGGTLSRSISPFWAAIEHWRVEVNWWEYCLIHKGNIGDYVKTWRIRPIAFIGQDGKLQRLWKGQTHYSTNTTKNFIIGTICTILTVPFLVFVTGFFSLFTSL